MWPITAYRAERGKLRAQLAELTPPELPKLRRAVELLQGFGTIWDATAPKERKQIVHTLLEAVHLESGEDGPLVVVDSRVEFTTLFGMMRYRGFETGRVAHAVSILAPGGNTAEALTQQCFQTDILSLDSTLREILLL